MDIFFIYLGTVFIQPFQDYREFSDSIQFGKSSILLIILFQFVLKNSLFRLENSLYELKNSPYELKDSQSDLNNSQFGWGDSQFELNNSQFGLENSHFDLLQDDALSILDRVIADGFNGCNRGWAEGIFNE